MKKSKAKCPKCSIRFTVNKWGLCRLCFNARQRGRYRQDPTFRGKQRVRRMVNRYVNPHTETKHQLDDHRSLRRALMAATADGTVTRAIMLPLVTAPTCSYCRTALDDLNRSIDHVIPLSRGGTHTADNLAACCVSCNYDKADRFLHEWMGTRMVAL